MRLGTLLDRIAVDLNDYAFGHEYTTWSREQLRTYLEEGIQTAFMLRPDLFTEVRIIKLKPCTVVHDTCDCTQIYRVIGQATADGQIVKLLKQRKSADKFTTWTGRTCAVHPRQFELTHYYIDDAVDKIWVYPQVPAGLDIYIAIECAVMPDDFSDNYEINPEIKAAVVQWVLYRAKMVDGEYNPAIISVANAHKSTFNELLQIQVVSKSLAVERDNERS